MCVNVISNDYKISIHQGRRLHCLPRQISQTGLKLQPLDLVDDRQRGETVDRRLSTVPRLISRTHMHAAHETLQPRHHVRSNNGMPLGISHKRIMPNHFPGLTPWLLVLGYIKDALPPAGGTLSFSLFPSPCPAASFLFISLCDLRPPQH